MLCFHLQLLYMKPSKFQLLNNQPVGVIILKCYIMSKGSSECCFLLNVRSESVSYTHLNNLISIDIDLSAEMKGVKIKARIMDGDSVLAEKTVKQHDELKLKQYEYWSPENPKLYDLFITVSVGRCV